MLTEETHLCEAAWQARDRAYAPYSKFAVGAALRTSDGSVFTGCNVENISFGLTCCAERVAIFNAIAAGKSRFVEIVIVADTVSPVTPCGACRQVMAEFAPELQITSINLAGDAFSASIQELLPRAKEGILDVPHGT